MLVNDQSTVGALQPACPAMRDISLPKSQQTPTRDRVPQGCGTRASRDGFTACPELVPAVGGYSIR